MNEKTNLLVIGIDGACWPLINKIVDSGKLPNLKSLMENGVWGDMKSCIPPITCPAWKCYSTGKNPGKLGVFWWEYLDIKNKRSIIPDSRSFDSKEIWDYLNDNGLKTGIIGMPTTFPPKKVNGVIIAGAPGAENKGYAYPNEIEKDLEEKFKYDPNPNIFSVLSPTEIENREKIIDESLKHIESNFIIAEYLFKKERPDFLQVCTFTINGPLQHFFYNDEPTIKASDLPDNIKDVDDSILKEVIECNNANNNCAGSKVLRIIPQELKFYKKMNLPLPRLCPDCRHRERIKQRNPLKLWKRKCMNKGCDNTFETTYSPDRKEIIYCEECYNKEVS